MARAFENTRKPKREGKLITVGNEGAVPVGRGATIQLKNGAELALFNVSGKLYAIENFCPHRGYPLADSRLYGEMVECDVHGYRFDVRTGECLTKSDCGIESYEVSIEDGMIKILV
jgi:nitrite reductase/ring-hydroxylating ferredoxin subunit